MKRFSQAYLSLITGQFRGLNLTRIVNEDDFYHKQILDSVLPLEESELFRESLTQGTTLLDVGFGAGVPLLPLAYRLPEVECLGIEARRKKVAAVRSMAKQLKLANVRLAHGRLEEFLLTSDSPVLTFKAVGDVERCLAKIRAEGRVRAFFYKGSHFYQRESLDFLSSSSWSLIEERAFSLPQGEKRLFLGFERTFLPGECLAKHKKLVNLTGVI